MLEQLQSYQTYFSPREQEALDRAVGVANQFAYESANNHIIRWDMDLGFEKFHPDVRDTNHDHILGCLHMADTYQNIYKNLAKRINMFELKCMILLHDADEVPDRKDIPMCHPVRDTDEWSTMKRRNQMRVTLGMIPKYVEPEYQEYATSLYLRFIRQDPSDVTALFARYIDKSQGNRFGCEHVFPFSLENPLEPTMERRTHVTKSIESIMKPATMLYPLLTVDEQDELTFLVMGDIGRFEHIGFANEARGSVEQWYGMMNRDES